MALRRFVFQAPPDLSAKLGDAFEWWEKTQQVRISITEVLCDLLRRGLRDFEREHYPQKEEKL